MMKPAQLAQKLSAVADALQCPRCGAAFALTEHSLVCQNRHCYDLSRYGYVNLAPAHDQSSEKYRSDLFESRAMVFADGFYQPVLHPALRMLRARFGDRPFTLLDVGCGEGYYARAIAQAFPKARVVGLDISRDAIRQAAKTPSAAHWLVADLKRLPVADGAADVVLDVLTPADYAEFRRVLKDDGELIKAVPGERYLCEVRRAVAQHLRSGDSYDNARVIDHLRSQMRIISEETVCATSPVDERQSAAFLRMTPMTFSVPQEVLQTLSLSTITVHMSLLRCQK